MNEKLFTPITTPREARLAAKRILSRKRYHHTVCVAAAARRLAAAYGEDKKRAMLAAYLHDIAKELPPEKLRRLADYGELAGITGNRPVFPVLHAFAGARLAEQKFGIKSPDLLNAIRYHTTGRAGMSRLEKIIFVADYISADRRYETAKIVRRAAELSLELAAAEELRLSIEHLQSKRVEIMPLTIAAYNDLKGKQNDIC